MQDYDNQQISKNVDVTWKYDTDMDSTNGDEEDTDNDTGIITGATGNDNPGENALDNGLWGYEDTSTSTSKEQHLIEEAGNNTPVV